MKFSEHGIGGNNDILEILINQSLSDKTEQMFQETGLNISLMSVYISCFGKIQLYVTSL